MLSIRHAMTNRYEFLVRDDGCLELRDTTNEDRWIATDAPVECIR